jgi:hypothetical protein
VRKEEAVNRHFRLSCVAQSLLQSAPASGSETKSIFSVVREDDSVFDHDTPSYDGKDELN